MSFSTPEQVITQLKWRYAVKKFDTTRKISADTWAALEDTMVLAPSSFGLQPWKFVVVENPEIRKQLQPASWNQTQIVEASHLVVFSTKKNLNSADVSAFIDLIAATRQTSKETLAMYQGLMDQTVASKGTAVDDWSARQVYLAVGVALTAAASLGIDACPIEGFDPAAYNSILGLTDCSATCVVAFGYRSDSDDYAKLPKVRWAKDQVIVRK